MKIAQIVCSYPPYYSGMGNSVFQLSSELTRRGHEVEVFTPQYQEPTAERIAFARSLKPSLSYGNAARLPQIKHMLDEFDIVHLHYPFFGTANIVRNWKKKHQDKPLVITYHMDNRSPGWKGLIFSLYAKYWMPKILGVADGLITSSFDYLSSSDANVVYNQKKKVWSEIPFGVDVETFSPKEKPQGLFEQFGLDIQTSTLVFVGGMDTAHYFKGIPVLLNALFALKKNGILIQAVLVGDGNLRPEYEMQTKALGLSAQVKFAGRVTDNDLPFYYAMADLAVLPSVHSGEAFGMVLLEAMASGIPVIASNLPGVRVIAEKAGAVVPAKDSVSLAVAIQEFFALPDVDRLAMKQKARDVAVTEFSWSVIGEKVEQVYHSCLSNNIAGNIKL